MEYAAIPLPPRALISPAMGFSVLRRVASTSLALKAAIFRPAIAKELSSLRPPWGMQRVRFWDRPEKAFLR